MQRSHNDSERKMKGCLVFHETIEMLIFNKEVRPWKERLNGRRT